MKAEEAENSTYYKLFVSKSNRRVAVSWSSSCVGLESAPPRLRCFKPFFNRCFWIHVGLVGRLLLPSPNSKLVPTPAPSQHDRIQNCQKETSLRKADLSMFFIQHTGNHEREKECSAMLIWYWDLLEKSKYKPFGHKMKWKLQHQTRAVPLSWSSKMKIKKGF